MSVFGRASFDSSAVPSKRKAEGEDTEEVVALCVEEVWDLLRVVVKAVALRYRVPVVGREELLVILVLYRV